MADRLTPISSREVTMSREDLRRDNARIQRDMARIAEEHNSGRIGEAQRLTREVEARHSIKITDSGKDSGQYRHRERIHVR